MGYFWESMAENVKDFIEICAECIMAKNEKLLTQKEKL